MIHTHRCRDRLSESLAELADIETKINRAKRTQVSSNESTSSHNTADRELENLLRAANAIESSRNVTDAQVQLAVAYVLSLSLSLSLSSENEPKNVIQIRRHQEDAKIETESGQKKGGFD